MLGDALGPSGQDLGPVAVAFKHERAEVFIVPIRAGGATGERQATRFFELLAPGKGSYPPYLDQLVIGPERDAPERIRKIEAEVKRLREKISSARRVKQILYFTDRELEVEVVRFFTKELAVPARHVGGNIEDFWLVTDTGEDWCIGEVKGPGKENVQRPDIGALDAHRGEAGRPADFPALLVANTFHRRDTIDSRDESVHPNECRRAANDHIVVVRTLDLVRMKMLAVQGQRPQDELLAALREGGGWFEVNSDLQHRLHLK